jgi:hypothetical protein
MAIALPKTRFGDFRRDKTSPNNFSFSLSNFPRTLSRQMRSLEILNQRQPLFSEYCIQ